jgi:dCMP deaminase
MSRPTHDEMFMAMAHSVAARSTCNRGQVGAVIVDDRRPVSIGYNGAPPGMKHCTEVGCETEDHSHGVGWYKKWVRLGGWMGGTKDRPLPDMEDVEEGCQRTIHAEANSLAWAARRGISVEGATMYSTYSPCRMCASLIIAAGISRFVYDKEYRLGRLDLLDAVNIEVVWLLHL